MKLLGGGSDLETRYGRVLTCSDPIFVCLLAAVYCNHFAGSEFDQQSCHNGCITPKQGLHHPPWDVDGRMPSPENKHNILKHMSLLFGQGVKQG